MSSPGKAVANHVEGLCVDCGKPCLIRDIYIVRGEIWREAGMGPIWGSGYLHQRCLEARIGRKLTPDDLLVWFVKTTPKAVQFESHPDYLHSPEFLTA